MLRFLGRGSAFADEHNSAFFVCNNELVMLDCPATAFQKMKKTDLLSHDSFFVLVTHTHGDHAGGIGMFLQYVWFASNMKKQVTVVAPSKEVCDDLRLLLNKIEGCEPHWYLLITADELFRNWFISVIPTIHTTTLAGKCFGYHLCVNGINTVYTGDTAVLAPFRPLLSKGTYLYTEASVCQTGVHLYLPDILPELEALSATGVKVFLMHLDEETRIKELIKGTEIELAPLYE